MENQVWSFWAWAQAFNKHLLFIIVNLQYNQFCSNFDPFYIDTRFVIFLWIWCLVFNFRMGKIGRYVHFRYIFACIDFGDHKNLITTYIEVCPCASHCLHCTVQRNHLGITKGKSQITNPENGESLKWNQLSLVFVLALQKGFRKEILQTPNELFNSADHRSHIQQCKTKITNIQITIKGKS